MPEAHHTFTALALRHLDGLATGEEIAQLQDALTDPDNARLYRDLCLQQELLRELAPVPHTHTHRLPWMSIFTMKRMIAASVALLIVAGNYWWLTADDPRPAAKGPAAKAAQDGKLLIVGGPAEPSGVASEPTPPWSLEAEAGLIVLATMGQPLQHEGRAMVQVIVEETLKGELRSQAVQAGDARLWFGCIPPAGGAKRLSERFPEGSKLVVMFRAPALGGGYQITQMTRTDPRRVAQLRRFCAFWAAAKSGDAAAYRGLLTGTGALDDAGLHGLRLNPCEAAGEALHAVARRGAAVQPQVDQILATWLGWARSGRAPGLAALRAAPRSAAFTRRVAAEVDRYPQLAARLGPLLQSAGPAQPRFTVSLPDTSGPGAPPIPWRVERLADQILVCKVGEPFTQAGRQLLRLEVVETLIGAPGATVDVGDRPYWFGCVPPPQVKRASAQFAPGSSVVALLRKKGNGWELMQVRRGAPSEALRRFCAVSEASGAGDLGELRTLLAAGLDRPALEALQAPTAAGIRALAEVNAKRATALAKTWAQTLGWTTLVNSNETQVAALIGALRVAPGGREALIAQAKTHKDAGVRQRIRAALQPPAALFVVQSPDRGKPVRTKPTAPWHHERLADVIALCTMGKPIEGERVKVLVDEVVKGTLAPGQISAPDARLWFGCIRPAKVASISEKYRPGARVICLLSTQDDGWRLARVTLQRPDSVTSVRRYGAFWKAAQRGSAAVYKRLLTPGIDGPANHGLQHYPCPAAGRALSALAADKAAPIVTAWANWLRGQHPGPKADAFINGLIGALKTAPGGRAKLEGLATKHANPAMRKRIAAALR